MYEGLLLIVCLPVHLFEREWGMRNWGREEGLFVASTEYSHSNTFIKFCFNTPYLLNT